MPFIGKQLLEAGMSDNGGWSKAQFLLLGLEWTAAQTPKRGWRRRINGRWISQEDADEFVRLKNAHLKKKGGPS